MPFPGIGTAGRNPVLHIYLRPVLTSVLSLLTAHAHISLNSRTLTDADLQSAQMSFMASVLQHLPALCAFTMPQAVSYQRVADDAWTGGTWVAWGTQNREVPLRRVPVIGKGAGDRWEVRCLDGMANMYLALGAILGAGRAGLRDGANMSLGDCLSTCWPLC